MKANDIGTDLTRILHVLTDLISKTEDVKNPLSATQLQEAVLKLAKALHNLAGIVAWIAIKDDMTGQFSSLQF